MCRKSILIVDDNQSVRRMLELHFSRLFRKVFTADNGLTGMRKFIQERPDIVITDIEMPMVNGLTMVKNLFLNNPKTKVVCMSSDIGYGDSIPDNVKFFQKPFDFQELTGCVMEMADQQG